MKSAISPKRSRTTVLSTAAIINVAAGVAVAASCILFLAPTASATNLTAVAAAKTAFARSFQSLLEPNTTYVPSGPQGPYLPQQGLPQIAMIGSAGLFLFYGGVLQGLIEKGLLVPGVSQLSGQSGGAIAASVVAAGVPPNEILKIYDAAPLYCNATLPDDWLTTKNPDPVQSFSEFKKHCLQTFEWPTQSISNALRQVIPESAVPQVSQTVRIWASQLSPLTGRLPGSQRVPSTLEPYTSKEDLLNKITASSNIPCVTAGTTYTAANTTEGLKPFNDGGFSANFQNLCIGATNVNRCVTVAATLLGPNAWQTSTDASGNCDNNLVPPPQNPDRPPFYGYGNYPYVPQQLWKLGKSAQCDVAGFLGIFSVFSTFTSTPPGMVVNINPGKRTPLPLTPCQWGSFFLAKANSTVSKLIYDHGIAEAKAFAAQEFGL